MGTRATQRPAIPIPDANNVIDVLNALKEHVEVNTKTRGDPLDGYVSYRDLVEGGIANFYDRSTVGAGGVGPGIPDAPPDGGPFLTPPEPDTLPLPDRPQNVRTVSLWNSIMVKWDWPNQTGVEWHYAKVWVSATPEFTDGNLGGFATMNFWIDEDVGLSSIPGDPPEPGVRYYWVAWEGVVDGEVTQTAWSPYDYEDGVRGQTAVDPDYVLGILQGQITESQIFSSLNERINLVDYDSDGNQYFEPVQDRILAAKAQAESGVYAAIAQYAGVEVTENELRGEYNIRLDLNGYVVGFGISALATINQQNPAAGATAAFVIKSDTFAVVRPTAGPNDVPIIPFIVGEVDGESTVGIDGQLVVDGTITARHILADSIGATEINSESVWTGLMSAERVITSRLETSGDEGGNFRVAINGRGSQYEQYPIWYGNGAIGGPGSVFYLDNLGNVAMAGNLFVTGAGLFYAGAWGDEAATRVEIGGPNDPFALWAGSGLKNTDPDNYVFYIDVFGNAKFRGTVEADFVSGEISRTAIISEFEDVNLPAYTGTDINTIPAGTWVTIGTYALPAPVFDAGHIPNFDVAINVFGLGANAAAVRVLGDPGNNPSTHLMSTVLDISNYGGTFNVKATANARVYGTYTFRLQMCAFDSNVAVTTNRRNGLVLGVR